MCGPLKGAIAGAAVLEGWADDLAEGEALASAGGITFHPNHHFNAVGPMTGLTTASMPVLVVENRTFGNRAFCTINEGLGKVMRFGGNDAEVLARLAWLRDSFAPVLGKALRAHGFTDEDAWDIGAIAALFALSNRMANLTNMRPNDEFYPMGRSPK